MNAAGGLGAAQQLANPSAAIPNLADTGAADDDEPPELEAVEEEGPVDETGVDPKDIELVIQQVGCSRAKAVKVLKESGGDLINASACFVSSAPVSVTHLYLYLRSLRCSHGGKRVIGLFCFCTSTALLYIQKHPTRAYPPHYSSCMRRRPGPSSELDIIVRPFPPILHNFHP